jgi:hypothetical protein
VWIASDIEGFKPDSKIRQSSTKGSPSGIFQFKFPFSPTDSWPTGKYEVELYLNDAKKPTKALQFEIQ